jgi:hypothetical protein
MCVSPLQAYVAYYTMESQRGEHARAAEILQRSRAVWGPEYHVDAPRHTRFYRLLELGSDIDEGDDGVDALASLD